MSKACPQLSHVHLLTSQQIMGTPTTVVNAVPEAAEPKQKTFGVPQLITAMLKSGGHTTHPLFFPGRAPPAGGSGPRVELKIKGIVGWKPEETPRIAPVLPCQN